jgi:hypothetical protein
MDEIFEMARQGGPEDCDLAIMVNGDGGIHMVAGSDWGLEPLRVRHGATMAYRIARHDGHVRLEARSADRSSVRQSDQHERPRGHPPRATVPDFPRYLTIL